jgi:hypothetical protein
MKVTLKVLVLLTLLHCLDCTLASQWYGTAVSRPSTGSSGPHIQPLPQGGAGFAQQQGLTSTTSTTAQCVNEGHTEGASMKQR